MGEVWAFKDASGVNPFKDLAAFAISMLVLPHSNAEVERVFSQMNIVKSKLRNRMETQMANAILAIRAGLKRSGKSCFEYEIPDTVVAKIGTSETYGSNRVPVASTSARVALVPPSTSRDTSVPCTSRDTAVASTSRDHSASSSLLGDNFVDDLSNFLLL